MTDSNFDLFVIGAGSGGVRAARLAASMGAKTAIAENQDLGGTCVNVGCVPKKLFVYASHFTEDFAAAAGFGWQLEPPAFDWQMLKRHKDKEIERLQQVYAKLLDNSGAQRVKGRAKLIDAHTVEVNEKLYSSERILIATGGWPVIPDIPGKQHVVTSNEMFFLPNLPKRLLIVGAGYIGVEFAGIMRGLGVEVTLCHRGDKLLRGFDEDIRSYVAKTMHEKGINLLFNTELTSIEKHRDVLLATTDHGQILENDLVLYATGRKPNIAELNLEAVGVEIDEKGSIKTDEFFQTNVPSVFALGDVSNRHNLTPVATAEAMVFVNKWFGDKESSVDYDYIPTAVFSQPDVGTVGLTEAQAKERFNDVAVYKSEFTPLKHTLTDIGSKTMMKMLVDRQSDRVLGIHMVGADAGEIIQGMAVALRAGATKAVFDSTLGIHPTTAEEFVSMREPSN